MNKGFGPFIPLIIIGVVLFVEFIVVSTLFKKENTEHRQLLEASLISKSDKVETYVRSFLRATDLSSLQGIDAFGTGQIILPYEFDSTYHNTYNMPYWQIYEELIPPKEVLLNTARQKTAWVSSCYAENYFNSYQEFSDEVTLDGISILTTDSINNDEILVKQSPDLPDLSATLSGDFGWGESKNEITIIRSFRPYSRIDTKFGKVVERAEDIVYGDLLGKLIRNEIYIHDIENLNEVRNKLDELANNPSLAEPDIKIILKIPRSNDYVYDSGTGNAAAIINVTIYDNSINYSFYDFPENKIMMRYLGVNFLAKVGDQGLLGVGDEVQAQTLTKDCTSGLEIITPNDNICDFFTLAPTKTCDDSDGGKDYETPSTCTDFTGYYEDTCDGNNLYEYYPYPFDGYEICRYEEYNCEDEGKICSSGACVFFCSPKVCQDLFDLVVSKFGTSCGHPNYDPVADINKDKIINIFDLSQVGFYCGSDGIWCQARLDDTTDPCLVIPPPPGDCDVNCNDCSSWAECSSSAAGCQWCTESSGRGTRCLPQGTPAPPGYVCIF